MFLNKSKTEKTEPSACTRRDGKVGGRVGVRCTGLTNPSLKNVEDRTGVLGMFTPLPSRPSTTPSSQQKKTSDQPQPMTYEREKKKSGDVSGTKKKQTNKPITVFCSISSSIPASSSCFFPSTSSKHRSLNLLLHPTQLRFLDLRSCTPCGILHE